MFTASNLTTEEFIQRWMLSGDKADFNALLEALGKPLLLHLEYWLDRDLRSKIEPDDILQDINIEAIRRAEEYRANPVISFRPWIFRIAVDHVNRTRRQYKGAAMRDVSREQRIGNVTGDSSTAGIADWLVASITSPSSRAARNELLRRIEKALANLKSKEFQIYELRIQQGWTNQEVAQFLGIPEPTAAMRYLRLIQKFRKILGIPAEGL